MSQKPRYHIHYTSTYSSWLNQVEIWFNIITQRAIRRGPFSNTQQLTKNIDRFVNAYNADTKPFMWTAITESILAKIERHLENSYGTQQ